METKINVLIVDDQPRARQSLRAMLSTLPQVAAIREASNGLEAIHAVEEAQPDVVLMDVRMPVMDGLEATRQIKARWPQVRVIILSMYTDPAADAFVGKGEPPERLFGAIDSGLSETEGVQ